MFRLTNRASILLLAVGVCLIIFLSQTEAVKEKKDESSSEYKSSTQQEESKQTDTEEEKPKAHKKKANHIKHPAGETSPSPSKSPKHRKKSSSTTPKYTTSTTPSGASSKQPESKTATTTESPNKGNEFTSTSTKKPKKGGRLRSHTHVEKPPKMEDLEKQGTTGRPAKQNEEARALDFALAGLSAWIRSLEKNGRLYNKVKAGQLVYYWRVKLPEVLKEPLIDLEEAYLKAMSSSKESRPMSD